MSEELAINNNEQSVQIAQSRGSALMVCNYNIYQERILLHIAKYVHSVAMKGSNYSEHLQRAYCVDDRNINMSLSVRELIGSTHNYAPLKSAIVQMQREWIVQYYDKISRKWYSGSIISNVELAERTGTLTFTVAKWLVEYIADFRQGGYVAYSFSNAIKIRNAYAARLYLLFCSATHEITYKIEQLRIWLGLKNKVKRNTDFIRRIIEPARAELEKRAFNGFTYRLSRSAECKTRSKDQITFCPIKREHSSKLTIAEMRRDVLSINHAVIEILMSRLCMSTREIYNNKDLLCRFSSNVDCISKLTEIINRAFKKDFRDKKRYVIGAIKKALQQG